MRTTLMLDDDVAVKLDMKKAPLRFYVSTSGNDAWSGRQPDPAADGTDGPFATLERARDAVRESKKAGPLPHGGIEVCLRGGVYPFSRTFDLTAADSGAQDAPVVWRPCRREKVCFSGGRAIGGFEPLRDVERERVKESRRDRVLRVDLKALGIGDYGALEPRGNPGMELFFRGKRMRPAAWPKKGWLTVADVPQDGPFLHEGTHFERHGIRLGRHCGRIAYTGNRPKRWRNAHEILLHGYWTWDWNDSYQRIAALDTRKREIEIRAPHHGYGYTKAQRFRFLNILEELSKPGEWALDRANGILYFWPPAEIREGDAHVSLLEETMVSLKDTAFVTLRGFTFESSRGNAIRMSGGRNNAIAGCTFRNLGSLAVQIQGGTENGIVSCDLHDLASGGILLEGGDRKTLTPAGNHAVNNHIHHFSLWVRTYQWAINLAGVGNRVAHNLMHDTAQEAMYTAGNEHLIEFNEIHTIGLETGDIGAIHTGRDWTWRGTIYRYNYLHDLHGPGLHGVMGIYLDDWQSGATIYGNVFCRAGQAAHVGGGRNNVIENNIFIDCKASVHVDARGLSWADFYFNLSLPHSVRTLLDRMEAMNYRQPPYSGKYPELLKLYDDEPAVPKYNKILRNVSCGGKWVDFLDGVDFALVQTKGNLIAGPDLGRISGKEGERKVTAADLTPDNRVMDGDPGFVDLKGGNFQLRDDSPAWQLGFQRIPIEKIGLYADEHRRSLPGRKKKFPMDVS